MLNQATMLGQVLDMVTDRQVPDSLILIGFKTSCHTRALCTSITLSCTCIRRFFYFAVIAPQCQWFLPELGFQQLMLLVPGYA
jgi:phosphatidylglycerophosphate synthase